MRIDGDGDACKAAVTDLRQSLASLYGNNQGLDLVTLHWVELYQRSMGDDLADRCIRRLSLVTIAAS
ncbi:hypothetical protein AGR4C_Lc120145 [Agrobacterium tumefaciens str. Kerr 14]|uniref:Uncharacterized protein n=1 Tax=Agrobacterium tumefaciens str. Kerr 14 TaxID=1183424 RepID=A0A1S7R976_AGRTU|nr:hypothetical protein AGR4C_Lc120145 [Agrobacterium tumefaciens str. Kerr 14]